MAKLPVTADKERTRRSPSKRVPCLPGLMEHMCSVSAVAEIATTRDHACEPRQVVFGPVWLLSGNQSLHIDGLQCLTSHCKLGAAD
jgi:hypothetical protein